MAALNFTKTNDVYISDEFQVTGNFNLHIERKDAGNLAIVQKTAGTKFVSVRGTEYLSNYTFIDEDIQCLVPKTFKVVSASEVTVAEVTTV